MNTHTLELDLSKDGLGAGLVRVGQGDTHGTTIKALIYDGGAEAALSGYSGYLEVLLPNKRNYYRAACAISGNTATVVVDEAKLCQIAGYTDEAYFTFEKNGVRYSTERFAIEILRCVTKDMIPAQNWDDAIDSIITRGNAAVSTANTAATNAQDAAGVANEAADRVDDAIANAKSATDAANSAVVSANSAASACRTATTNANNATSAASSAATSATSAANAANAAATAANGAADAANDAAARVETDIAAVNAATDIANKAADKANQATTNAEYDRQESIGQFAGRSLASVFADEIATKTSIYDWLHSRIQAGNFSGLRIGDYMDVPVTAGTNVPAQTVRYMIAAIDPYYQCSDQAMPHHIAFAPNAPVLVSGTKATNGSNIMWNTTATNNGNSTTQEPYFASHLHGWELSDYLPALPSALKAVLINHRSLVEKRYGTTAQTEASNWGFADLGKVWSMSEVELYGFPVWGSKGYSVGMDCHFPLFSTSARRLMGSRVNWWLRSVVGGSSSGVCIAGSAGHANSTSATNIYVRPRPCFLLG